MIIDFSQLSASEYAAWWGAIIATLTLVWGVIVTIRSGARVYVTATPNMRIYPTQPTTGESLYISVKAVNRGTSPTTITHLLGYYAPTVLDSIRKQKRQHFVIPAYEICGNIIPYVLKPGEEWGNLVKQENFEEEISCKYLYVGVQHNQKKETIYKRVKITPKHTRSTATTNRKNL